MERIADEVEEGYEKLSEAEEYQGRIKQDLGRLDGEKHAYLYRKSEVMNLIADTRGMAIICPHVDQLLGAAYPVLKLQIFQQVGIVDIADLHFIPS